MKSNINLFLINIKNKDYFTSLLLFIFLLISYYNALYYVFADYRDEIGYLSDSLLLAEGMRPSYSHAPSGLSTWTGTIYFYLNLFFEILKNLFTLDINLIFSSFDKIIFNNYTDLTGIKSTLFFLNFIFFVFFFYKSNNTAYKILFCLCFFSPFLFYTTFSGKPYFLACLLASLALTLNDKDEKLALIFLALAICERLEFIILINYILCKYPLKQYFQKLLYIILIFFAVSPWFSMALFQNLKVILGYVHQQPSLTESVLGLKLNVYFFIYALTIFFIYPLLKFKKKYNLILLFSALTIFILITFYSNVPLRWFFPLLLIFLYFLSRKLLFLEKENLTRNLITNSILIIFLLFFNFNLKSKISDLRILELEQNSQYENVAGPKLLKEISSFKNYSLFLKTYLYNYNIKNKNFFNKEKAPLAFGQSGNLEILQNRRYEYISKYQKQNNKNKYIFSDAGLYKTIKYYCQKFNNKNISYYDFTKRRYTKCN